MNDAFLEMVRSIGRVFDAVRGHMTEQEWRTCRDPKKMRWALEMGDLTGATLTIDGHTSSVKTFRRHPSATDRKLRLWCAALVTACGLHKPGQNWHGSRWLYGDADEGDFDENGNTSEFVSHMCQLWAEQSVDPHIIDGEPSQEAKADLFREIIGNPFRPVTLGNPHLLGATVLALARTAYDNPHENGTLDLDCLKALSDALEDMGCPTHDVCPECRGKSPKWKWRAHGTGMYDLCERCKNSGRVAHPLLAHLRSPGPHYRGCHVIDKLLGKE